MSELLSGASPKCRHEGCQLQRAEDAESKIGRWQIEIEKALCNVLGMAWAPTGISINSLIAEIDDRLHRR
jgi:hypothetical protein